MFYTQYNNDGTIFASVFSKKKIEGDNIVESENQIFDNNSTIEEYDKQNDKVLIYKNESDFLAKIINTEKVIVKKWVKF